MTTYLRKPVSAATLYGVIALTPPQRSFARDTVSSFSGHISYVEIRKEAFLLPESTATPRWMTRIRPLDATIRVIDDPREDCMNQVLDTLFELAKLEGRSVHLKPSNPSLRNICVEMNMDCHKAFVERVS
jgi:hypothetical protein